MKNYIIENRAYTYKRIHKTTARKLFNQDYDICLCSSKLRPGEIWHPETIVHFNNAEPENTFDKYVREFEYYNCTMNETGYSAAFYLVTEK